MCGISDLGYKYATEQAKNMLTYFAGQHVGHTDCERCDWLAQ